MTKTISISAGHWLNVYSGASRILNEVTENRRVVEKVAEILTNNKIKVNKILDDVSTNQTDNVNYLIKQHKKFNADLDVQIHFNSSVGTVAKALGTEVCYFNTSQKLNAVEMSKAIATAGGFINRSAKYRNNLGFLLNLRSSLLLEVCFVNSEVDAKLYKEKFDDICFAIAKTLAKFIGATITEVKPTTAKPTEKTDEANTLYRVKSGTFSKKEDAEAAKKKVATSGVAKEEFIKIYEMSNNKGFYFETGTYSSDKLANEALEKLKRLKIIQVGSIVKVRTD